jgi:hypothetical protein
VIEPLQLVPLGIQPVLELHRVRQRQTLQQRTLRTSRRLRCLQPA